MLREPSEPLLPPLGQRLFRCRCRTHVGEVLLEVEEKVVALLLVWLLLALVLEGLEGLRPGRCVTPRFGG